MCSSISKHLFFPFSHQNLYYHFYFDMNYIATCTTFTQLHQYLQYLCIYIRNISMVKNLCNFIYTFTFTHLQFYTNTSEAFTTSASIHLRGYAFACTAYVSKYLRHFINVLHSSIFKYRQKSTIVSISATPTMWGLEGSSPLKKKSVGAQPLPIRAQPLVIF